MKIQISEIKIGERIREDVGDLTALEKSINRFGLIHPITITENKELLTGMRRLLSCKNLGWNEIDATVINLKESIDKLDYESQENILRKELTQQELESLIERKKRYLKKKQGIRNRFVSLIKKFFTSIKNKFRRKKAKS